MIFDIYKRGQGKNTRLCTAFGSAIVIGLGCLQLYVQLEATELGLWVATMVPAGVFVALSFLTFWLINKPSVADFMIAAENEMKKVNWSTRKEIAVSTLVVIVVVIFTAILIGIADLGFQLFFMWILD